MNYKYALVDEESNTTIGYFRRIIGITPQTSENVAIQTLTLGDFHFSDLFFQTNEKKITGSLYLLILDGARNTVGSYYIAVEHAFTECTDTDITVTISGYIEPILTMETFRLWEYCKALCHRNGWVTFSASQRSIWLTIIRARDNCINKNLNTRMNKPVTYVIDGRLITDNLSFYFALGESLKGPAGYFGGCLDSLQDCLCGGFGVEPPFIITLKNLEDRQWRSLEPILRLLSDYKVTLQ